jgi:hypothetical protein
MYSMDIMMCTLRQLRACRRSRGAFTLIETAVATVIVGLGTVAMMALLAAGTTSNIATGELTTAVDLANNIHELSAQLSYPTTGTWGMPNGETISDCFTTGNVSWLNGASFNPPIDATANAISGMSSWEEVVTVNNVNPNNVAGLPLSPNATSNPLSSVTVTIYHNHLQPSDPDYHKRVAYQTSWLVAAQ